MRRGLSAAGRRAKRSSRLSKRAGVERINIHGAIDLETGQTRMIEALTIDAASTIRLLQSIEALIRCWRSSMFSWTTRVIHHAKLVQEWLALPGRRIKLHFIPTYCPHLEPDRTVMGPHAQKRHSQQVLRNLCPVRRCDAQFSA